MLFKKIKSVKILPILVLTAVLGIVLAGCSGGAVQSAVSDPSDSYTSVLSDGQSSDLNSPAADSTSKSSAGGSSTQAKSPSKPESASSPASAEQSSRAAAPSASSSVTSAAASHQPQKEQKIYFEINYKTIIDKGFAADASHKDGVVFSKSIDLKSGESVIDILKRVTRENKIQAEIEGGTFVKGIDNVYTDSKYGSMSGWLYSVNGEFPMVSGAKYKPKAGDTVKFLFTCDNGNEFK